MNSNLASESIWPEVERFDPEAPLTSARTPPASWYAAPEFLRLERETV